MATLEPQDRLLAEIAQNEDHKYFDVLRQGEPALPILGFAAKLYRRSHSTNTITSYCKGICAFREMLLHNNKTLTQLLTEIKAQGNGQAYKILDEFGTWCDASGRFSPRTTANYFGAVVKFFEHLEIDIDDRKIKNIEATLPRAKAIKDEIPSNEDLRKIDSSGSITIQGVTRLMRDTGFEPIDVCQLKVKDIKFDETPARVNKDREKTGEALEGFLAQDTVATLKRLILTKNKQQDDYLFTDKLTGNTLKSIRERYNLAVARAGFGKLERKMNKKTGRLSRRYLPTVNKIEGHKCGKYHMKVYKKRWFTLVVSSGIPEYVAQGMLGRKQYLDEYMRLSLEQKRVFATKILKVVSLYNEKPDKEEIRKQAAQTLGLENMTPEQAEKLKSIFTSFLAVPQAKLTQLLKTVKETD